MSTGFVTVSVDIGDKPHRLAYMQVLHEVPPQPVTKEGHAPMDAGGRGTYRFYEIWNEPIWRKLAEDIGASPWEALLEGFADGSITMRKIFRRPGHASNALDVRARLYNTKAATVEAVDENDCVMLFGLPKDITITGHLAGTTSEILPLPSRPPTDEHPVRTYVVKIDDDGSFRLHGDEGLADYLKDLKLDPGQTITITG